MRHLRGADEVVANRRLVEETEAAIHRHRDDQTEARTPRRPSATTKTRMHHPRKVAIGAQMRPRLAVRITAVGIPRSHSEEEIPLMLRRSANDVQIQAEVARIARQLSPAYPTLRRRPTRK